MPPDPHVMRTVTSSTSTYISLKLQIFGFKIKRKILGYFSAWKQFFFQNCTSKGLGIKHGFEIALNTSYSTDCSNEYEQFNPVYLVLQESTIKRGIHTFSQVGAI
jgi:hypothetical protein